MPFRFFNMWCDHPDFNKIVENVWCTPVCGRAMYKVYYKLKLLRSELRKLNRRGFDNISGRVLKCRDELEAVRSRLQLDPFNVEIQREERMGINELQRLIKWEKSFLNRNPGVSGFRKEIKIQVSSLEHCSRGKQGIA